MYVYVFLKRCNNVTRVGKSTAAQAISGVTVGVTGRNGRNTGPCGPNLRVLQCPDA